jgi:hypothetical protein
MLATQSKKIKRVLTALKHRTRDVDDDAHGTLTQSIDKTPLADRVDAFDGSDPHQQVVDEMVLS